jgi:predicted transposase YdaD
VRYADATAYATIRTEYGTKTEVIVHIEFQTDADDTMPIRMAGYIGRLIDMYRRPVHASVIYLRPQEIDDPGIYQYTFPNKFMATYNVLKIWEFDGEELLSKRILGLLPFTPLMQPEGVSDEEWLRKCVRTIEESVTNEQDRKDLLASTSVLAGLVHDVNFVKTFIPEEIMRQSSVIKEILRKEGIQYIISVLEARFGEVDDTIKNKISPSPIGCC